ncbi:MAG TPA: chemotaxis-specific protein-glutamate methyltransferase CheB [Longimicrobiaceae bacterium]|nr:chemotaxis-specific protein-glutamate methyltransferase CheB [Longimicrobiaceae bacterium]
MAEARAPATPLRVMVVDDSAVARESIRALLSGQADLRVEVVPDPVLALERVLRNPPDVLLLDLEMPRMHGLTLLRRVMARHRVPVVVCAGVTSRSAQAAVQALREGAVDVIPKDWLHLRHGAAAAEVLLTAVRAAARARPRPVDGPEPQVRTRIAVPAPASPRAAYGVDVVAVGASTGGPEALRRILASLPVDAPPLVIVQHMPGAFTGAFARSLDAACAIAVREARDGDEVLPGTALLAPGDRHLALRRVGGRLVAGLSAAPPVSRHRPSVDVLFRSAAIACGHRAVGVILTGMGDDGADGLLQMRRAGAATIAQDDATCVVFGMPGEAVARDAAGAVLPLPAIAAAILRHARGHRGTAP